MRQFIFVVMQSGSKNFCCCHKKSPQWYWRKN